MRRHNGSHRPPAYYEWWYFHFLSADGTAINMVLHETDIFGLQADPYISLTVLLPGQAPRYVRRPLPMNAFQRAQPLLQVGDGLFRETDASIQFNVPFGDGVRFAGRIAIAGPPLIIEDGLLYVDEVTGRSSHWVVPVPHGRFVALLALEGRQHRLEGVAYHDHQWGSLPIQEFVSDWIWGHFAVEGQALLFFQILTQHGGLIERVGVIGPSGVFVGNQLAATYLGRIANKRDPSAYSWPACLALAQCGRLEALTIEILEPMRVRDSEQIEGQLGSYFRWRAQASLLRRNPIAPLPGVTEYLRIRRAL